MKRLLIGLTGLCLAGSVLAAPEALSGQNPASQGWVIHKLEQFGTHVKDEMHKRFEAFEFQIGEELSNLHWTIEDAIANAEERIDNLEQHVEQKLEEVQVAIDASGSEMTSSDWHYLCGYEIKTGCSFKVKKGHHGDLGGRDDDKEDAARDKFVRLVGGNLVGNVDVARFYVQLVKFNPLPQNPGGTGFNMMIQNADDHNLNGMLVTPSGNMLTVGQSFAGNLIGGQETPTFAGRRTFAANATAANAVPMFRDGAGTLLDGWVETEAAFFLVMARADGGSFSPAGVTCLKNAVAVQCVE